MCGSIPVSMTHTDCPVPSTFTPFTCIGHTSSAFISGALSASANSNCMFG